MPQNLDQGATDWHKSGYSDHEGDCVETGTFPDTQGVAVRDTKHHRTGPVLAFTATAWNAFLAEVKKVR